MSKNFFRFSFSRQNSWKIPAKAHILPHSSKFTLNHAYTNSLLLMTFWLATIFVYADLATIFIYLKLHQKDVKYKGVFGTQAIIYVGAFFKISYRLSFVNYLPKETHLRWLNSEYISEINQTFINKNWLYTEAATGGIL